MRYARLRRALGPLEPRVLDAYSAMWRWISGLTTRAVVVIATDAAHRDAAASLAAELDGAVGFWVTHDRDVAGLAELGWFVVRLDPASPDDLAEREVELLRRRVRVDRVIHLRHD